jgi:hypothetical protein
MTAKLALVVIGALLWGCLRGYSSVAEFLPVWGPAFFFLFQRLQSASEPPLLAGELGPGAVVILKPPARIGAHRLRSRLERLLRRHGWIQSIQARSGGEAGSLSLVDAQPEAGALSVVDAPAAGELSLSEVD